MWITKLLNKKISLNDRLRDSKYDLMKLYAMLSVVLDHLLEHLIEGNIQSTQLYNWIFLSQMPIFMFVSGYFALNGINKVATAQAFFQKLWKTVASLLIPFLSYAIIVSIIQHENVVLKSILYPDYSLWFLWALMWMQIIMLISQQIAKLALKKEIQRTIASICLYFVGLIPIGVFYVKWPGLFETKLIVFYSVFFLFGYFYNFIERQLKVLKSDRFKLVMIPVTVIIVVVVMVTHPTVMYDSENIMNIAVRFIGSFAATLLMLYVSSFVVKIKIMEKMASFGVLSLELYYVHLLLLRIGFFNGEGTTIPLFIAKYILLVVVSIVIIFIVKSNWVSDLVFFGKLPKKKEKPRHLIK